MENYPTKSVVEGNLIFLSSMDGRDEKTGRVSSDVFEQQMTVALDKIRAAMEAAGSSMNNIVRTFIVIKKLEDYPRMRKTEVEYYQKHAPLLVEDPPASTFIETNPLASPELLVQIDITGVISRDEPGSELKFYPEIWAGKKLAYPHVPAEHPKFATSAVLGNLVFVSGCEALNPETVKTETDDFEEQTIICFDKINKALGDVGSSMDNIFKTNMLLTNPDNYCEMRRIEYAYYQKHAPFLVMEPPVSTCIMPTSLARPEFQIEIEAFAVITKDAPDCELLLFPEYWGGRKLACPGVAPGMALFAQTAKVGNLIFTSGRQAYKSSEVFEQQMVGALDHVKMALEATGSSMNNIIKTHVLLTNPGNYSSMRKTEVEYYRKNAPLLVEQPPASSCFVVKSLDRPGYSVEIDVMAVFSRGK